jgi:hypothetical protein
LLLLLAAGATACGDWRTRDPVTPVSYGQSSEQVPRNLGRLRRLAFVPLSQTPHEKCWGGAGPAFRSVDDNLVAAQTAAGILTEEKGYELQPVTEMNSADLFAGESREQLLDEFTGWARLPRDEPLEVATASHAFAAAVIARHDVDGILLLWLRHSCSAAENPVLAGLLRGLEFGMRTPETEEALRAPMPLYDVTLIEAATLRPVLQARYGLMSHALPGDPLEELLRTLEPAVPKVLTAD